jgi:hypothetical protein
MEFPEAHHVTGSRLKIWSAHDRHSTGGHPTLRGKTAAEFFLFAKQQTSGAMWKIW